jgi:hypothetical protein
MELRRLSEPWWWYRLHVELSDIGISRSADRRRMNGEAAVPPCSFSGWEKISVTSASVESLEPAWAGARDLDAS